MAMMMGDGATENKTALERGGGTGFGASRRWRGFGGGFGTDPLVFSSVVFPLFSCFQLLTGRFSGGDHSSCRGGARPGGLICTGHLPSCRCSLRMIRSGFEVGTSSLLPMLPVMDVSHSCRALRPPCRIGPFMLSLRSEKVALSTGRMWSSTNCFFCSFSA